MIIEILAWIVRASIALSDVMARALLVYYALYAAVILARIMYGIYLMGRNNYAIRQAMTLIYNVHVILIDLVAMPILLGALCCDIVLLMQLLETRGNMETPEWYSENGTLTENEYRNNESRMNAYRS